jgi:hypothetical protein
MAGFSIKINPQQTEQVLSKAIQDMLRGQIKDVVRENRKKVIDIFHQKLVESPTFNALMDNWGLQGDLGVQISYVVETTRLISQMINLETLPPRSKDLGGIRVTLVRNNLEPILNSPYAQYETSKGVTIPWLEWLLMAGTNVLVADYQVAAEEDPGRYSRTGALIMIPSRGGNFSITPNYAGTINDNWITRAASAALPQIEQILMAGLRNG